MCNALLKILLNGLIGEKCILRSGTISSRRTRPTAIAAPLVHHFHIQLFSHIGLFDDIISSISISQAMFLFSLSCFGVICNKEPRV